MIRKYLPLAIILPIVFLSCTINVEGNRGLDGISNFSNVITNESMTTENRKTAAFDGVDISSAFDVTITDQAFNNEIQVSAPDFAMSNIVTKVEKGILKVYVDGSISLKNGEKLQISFPHRNLNNIKLSGASKLKADHQLKVDKLNINLGGATKLDLNVATNSLVLDHSGASKLDLKGNSQNFKANVSGASKLDASDLKVKEGDFKVSGASSVKIWVVNNLDIDASGASKVSYKASSGVKLKINKSGASKVTEF